MGSGGKGRRHTVCVCVCVIFSLLLCTSLHFTILATYHFNKDLFPCRFTCQYLQKCVRGAHGSASANTTPFQPPALLPPHPTPPWKTAKKCGEKSVWTQSINIQRWRPDLRAACLPSEWNQLSFEDTPLPPELTTCVTAITPPSVPLLHLSSFNLSIFSHWASILGRGGLCCLGSRPLLFFQPRRRRSQRGRLQKTGIQCSFLCCRSPLLEEPNFIGPVSDRKWLRNGRG